MVMNLECHGLHSEIQRCCHLHSQMDITGNIHCSAVYLFPEAYLKFKHDTLQEVPPIMLRAALLPRCNTKPSRDATLRLLRVLVLHDAANLNTGLRLIKQLHLTRIGPSFEHLPHHNIR